jgi:hypothetical protein
MRVEDPDGGPPWGIRTWRTSRQAACWQVGRIVGGKLGVLEAGRLRELPLQQDQCRPLDGNGRLYAVQEEWRRASGEFECVPGSCGNVRLVRYGFLGPQARSLRVGATEQALTGDAFLLVERADLDHPPTPRPEPIVVVYRDGSTRPATDYREDDPRPATAPPGIEAIGDTLPEDVRAPLSFTGRRRGKDMIYTLSYRAPVATKRHGVSYRVLISGPRTGRRCDKPMDFGGFDTPGDVRKGQRLTIKITPGIQIRYGHGWCSGTYRGKVILHDEQHVVGRFSFKS